MRHLNNRGSSHLIALFAVVVIALVGLAGYKVLQASTSTPVANTLPAPASHATVPQTIKTTNDVKQAATALDSTPVDSLDSSSLDADLSALQ